MNIKEIYLSPSQIPYKKLMGVSDSLEDLEKITRKNNVEPFDKDKLSAWMIQWFKSEIVERSKIPLRCIRSAILFQRKFKPLLNETFTLELAPYFLYYGEIPEKSFFLKFSEVVYDIFREFYTPISACVQFYSPKLTKEEICYLLHLIQDLDLKPEEILHLNALIQSFSGKVLDFELLEAILIIASTNESDALFVRLLTYPEERRKTYLVNFLSISDSIGNSLLKRDSLQQHIFSLNEDQREDLLLHLATHFKGMKYLLKSYYLKVIKLLPDTLPSIVFPALKEVFDCFAPEYDKYLIENWYIAFKEISDKIRSYVLLCCAPHLKNFDEDKLPVLFKILSRLPKERIAPATPPLLKCLSCFSHYSGVEDQLKDRINSHDPTLEFLECMEPFWHIFQDKNNRDASIDDFIYHIKKLKAGDIKQGVGILIPFKDKITSAKQFTALFRNLIVFYPKDWSELLPHFVFLERDTLYMHLSMALRAFPKDVRKDILIQASPYFSSLSIDRQFSDFVMTVGLSHFGANTKVSGSVEVIERKSGAKAPFISLKQLKQAKYSCSLVDFIAGYLGHTNNAIAVSAAAQWIQLSALHVFSDPVLFFRELAANALDSQLPWEKQIGNFGMGFYSVFSLFYQTQYPVDRLEIVTSYCEEGDLAAYKMIFYKDAAEALQVSWESVDAAPEGTTVQIYSKTGSPFPNDYRRRLARSLQDFRYFQHGFIEVTFDKEKDFIGNKESTISIHVSLEPSVITLADKGCGIPLSKIHLLLIPSISNKRHAETFEKKEFDYPIPMMMPTKNAYSSLIFTINSVVNSTYILDKKYKDQEGKTVDLLIYMNKSFKPNLSRDSIIITGRKCPQAIALKKMIEQCVRDVFRSTNNNSTLLQILSMGLKKWENSGVSSDLKGYFSGYFQSVLRKKLANLDCLPCHDHPWIINFKNEFFDDNGKYVPLPDELVPEGYTRFELDLIKKYEKMVIGGEEQVLREQGAKGQIIEGLSVFFLHDSWLYDVNKNTVVSSGPCASILFAPLSIIKEEPTLEGVQRRICQRFVDHGKRIKPAIQDTPTPLFSPPIYFPNSTFHYPESNYVGYRAKSLYNLYREKLELYLNSPFIKSLDKIKCTELFWNMCSKLSKDITCTDYDYSHKKRKGAFASHQVILEFTTYKESFGCGHTHDVDWENWFRHALLVQPESKSIYKIAGGADLSELNQQMSELHKKNQYYKKGHDVLPILLEKYPNLFEKVNNDEAFRRLCILMLVQWGVDPYQNDHLWYYEKGIKKPLDLDLLEKGIKNFMIPAENQEVAYQSLFYGGCALSITSDDGSQLLGRFAPLFSNLKHFLSPEVKLDLVQNLMDLCVIKKETLSSFSSYFDQLIELYYRFLSIPPEMFPYRYGTSYRLRTQTDIAGYPLQKAISLLNALPKKTGEKLLQQFMGKMTQQLNIDKRNYNLQQDKLKTPLLRGANSLGILSLVYNETASNLPLITSLIEMSISDEEIVSLALIVYFAKKLHPTFFDLPVEYQKDSLKIILGAVLRTEDPDKVNNILDESIVFYTRTLGDYHRFDLTSSMQAGINCIELFATRYKNSTQTNPLLFQNPLNLLTQSDLSVFFFPDLMETLFNTSAASEALGRNDIKRFLQLIQETPDTGRFSDFGMITHSSVCGNGYTAWQLPLIELLKNSISMAKGRAKIKLNFALLPCDADHSQLAYEISDAMGFEDLESLISLLIPGYHPRDSQQTASGFFRMLPEVSLIHYRTRLQGDKNQQISLIAQPLRNERNEIINLKIGLKLEKGEDSFKGTVYKVYMNPQKNIEALMLLRLTHVFANDLLDKIYTDESKSIKIYLNGDYVYIHSSDSHKMVKLETPFLGLFASCSSRRSDKCRDLLIDGFPHPITIERLLEQMGFNFYNIFKQDVISLPKEFFVPLQDPNKLVIKTEYKPVLAKFILDLTYRHLFDREDGNGCTKYLEHFDSDGSIDQLVSPPEKTLGSCEQILMNLNNESGYYQFFSNYSYASEIIVEGVKQKVRIPSFAEYLWQVYHEVFPKWVEERKSNVRYLSFEPFTQWMESKELIFKEIGNKFLKKYNAKLLKLVEKWVLPKFNRLKYRKLNEEQIISEAKPNEPQEDSTTHFALKESAPAKWIQAKSFVEEALSFYVIQVLSPFVEKPKVLVTLEMLPSHKAGTYRKSQHRIILGLNSHRLSQILSLLLSLAKKETDSHYFGDLIYSEIPFESGTLNHEIYHALKHAKGEPDEGHKHHQGTSFEVCARNMADQARARGVLTSLENKVLELVQKNNWTLDTLSELIKEAVTLEAT